MSVVSHSLRGPRACSTSKTIVHVPAPLAKWTRLPNAVYSPWICGAGCKPGCRHGSLARGACGGGSVGSDDDPILPSTMEPWRANGSNLPVAYLIPCRPQLSPLNMMFPITTDMVEDRGHGPAKDTLPSGSHTKPGNPAAETEDKRLRVCRESWHVKYAAAKAEAQTISSR